MRFFIYKGCFLATIFSCAGAATIATAIGFIISGEFLGGIGALAIGIVLYSSAEKIAERKYAKDAAKKQSQNSAGNY